MEISVRNLSGETIAEEPLREAARRALAAEGVSLRALSLALVDKTRMIALNRRLLQQDGPTDVIAFPAEDEEGEIILCPQVAAEQAAALGHSLLEELRFLVVHGVLHVCGWSDADPTARARMFKRQAEILAEESA